MKRFSDKVAVITGGSSGIGLATARRLKDEGARVVIAGRNLAALETARRALGEAALAVQVDVSNVADVDRLFSEVTRKLGKVDVLFVNAGVAQFAALEASDEEVYDRQFGINTRGAYFTIQRALPHLNDGAAIVLNSSVAGGRGMPNTSVYSATKAALRSFARTAAAELVARRIRVNTVAPGPILTPMADSLGIEGKEELRQMVPMKRLGDPDEVAAAVAFLASADASYITGVELNVDGGMGQI